MQGGQGCRQSIGDTFVYHNVGSDPIVKEEEQFLSTVVKFVVTSRSKSRLVSTTKIYRVQRAPSISL